MNWKEKTVVRILLMVAGWIAPSEWKKEIEQLGNHISVNSPKCD